MDIEFLLLLQRFRQATGGVFDAFMETASELITGVWIYLAVAAVYWCFDKRAGVRIALSIGAGNLLNQALKNTFCVYRPWVRDPRIVPVGDAARTATGYSFPSGHTQVAATMFGSLAVWQKKRRWCFALCAVLIFLVMLSRMYLGVHTPQDVLVSFLLGVLVIYMSDRLLIWAEGGSNRDWLLFGLGLVICGLYILYIERKPYPLDYRTDGSLLADPEKMVRDCYSAAGCAAGFLAGWLCERRLIRFSVPKDKGVRLLRFLAGAASLYALASYLDAPLHWLLGAHWGTFFYFAIAFFWVLAGCPWLFGLYERFLKKSEN